MFTPRCGYITCTPCTAYHITVLGNWQLVWQAEIRGSNDKSLPNGLGGNMHVTALPRRMMGEVQGRGGEDVHTLG